MESLIENCMSDSSINTKHSDLEMEPFSNLEHQQQQTNDDLLQDDEDEISQPHDEKSGAILVKRSQYFLEYDQHDMDSSTSATDSSNLEHSPRRNSVPEDITPPNVQHVVRDAGGLITTTHPSVYCTRLPAHTRSNSPLHVPFIVVCKLPVPDGTMVRLKAGNKFNPKAEMKNVDGTLINGVAKFPDVRFIGRSGRGRKLNIEVVIVLEPPIIAVYENAIKVTADGPREPRRQKPAPYNISDSWTHRNGSLSPNSVHTSDWSTPGIFTVDGEPIVQKSPHSVDSGNEEDVSMNVEPHSAPPNVILTPVFKNFPPMELLQKQVSSASSLVSQTGMATAIPSPKSSSLTSSTIEYEGKTAPISPRPDHRVITSSNSTLLPHKLIVLPTSPPAVISPPAGTASIPAQTNIGLSLNGTTMNSLTTTTKSLVNDVSSKPQNMATTSLVPIRQGKGAYLHPIFIQPNPVHNGCQAIFMPISPSLTTSPSTVPSSQFIHQKLQVKTPTSDGLKGEGNLSTDTAQNITYLKSLDHRGILKLLKAMDLEKYHQMFIKEHVDGELLSSMSELDLEELGITSSLHKKRFTKLIEGKHSAKDYLEKDGCLYFDFQRM